MHKTLLKQTEDQMKLETFRETTLPKSTGNICPELPEQWLEDDVSFEHVFFLGGGWDMLIFGKLSNYSHYNDLQCIMKGGTGLIAKCQTAKESLVKKR